MKEGHASRFVGGSLGNRVPSRPLHHPRLWLGIASNTNATKAEITIPEGKEIDNGLGAQG